MQVRVAALVADVKPLAKIRTEVKEQLERLGWERTLIYKMLLLTGLRKSELASLTIGQLVLDEPHPHAVLNAADEKNRRGSKIPLRDDLIADLRQWINDKLCLVQKQAIQAGSAIPHSLPANTPLLRIPAALVKILDRDLKWAGISKRDDRGRTVDVDAMRHTFGTMLSMGGVAPRTAQAAMRHSSIDLTMNVYTDPRLLDVAGALDSLPSFPLDKGPENQQERMTGTEAVDRPPTLLVPKYGPDYDKLGNLPTIAGKTADGRERIGEQNKTLQPPVKHNERRPLSSADSGRPNSGRLDSNQRPLRPERSTLAKLSYAPFDYKTARLRV